MIIPPKLNKGDKVALIATARHISKEELIPAIDIIKKWGLEVVFSENVFKIKNQFAGADNERANDLQKMLDDKSIKAIFCVRGGYGTVRIIDKIDFSIFLDNPKWLVGYSDVTVLHNHINNLGVASLHASMPINFKDNTAKSLAGIETPIMPIGFEGSGVVPKNGAAKRLILSSEPVCLIEGNPNADKSVRYSSSINTGLLPAAQTIVLAATSSALINPNA